MFAQFQTQLRFTVDEITQVAIEIGYLRTAFFGVVSMQEKTILLLKKKAFPTEVKTEKFTCIGLRVPNRTTQLSKMTATITLL